MGIYCLVLKGHTSAVTNYMYIVQGKGKGNGKAIPLQDWTGPEGSRRSRFPDFKTIGT